MEIIEKISFGEEKLIPEMKDLWRLNLSDNEEYINRYFDNFYKDSNCLVMFYNDRLVGTLHYVDTDAYYKGKSVKGAYIYTAVIEKKWRNHGIFTALHKRLKEFLCDNGFCFIYTDASLPAEFEFYKKLGYRAVFRKNFYKISKYKKIFGLDICTVTEAYKFYKGWTEEKKDGFCISESEKIFTACRQGYDVMSYQNCSYAVFEPGKHNYIIGEYAAPRLYGIPKIMYIDKTEKSGLLLPLTNSLDIDFIERQHPYLNYPINRKESI